MNTPPLTQEDRWTIEACARVLRFFHAKYFKVDYVYEDLLSFKDHEGAVLDGVWCASTQLHDRLGTKNGATVTEAVDGLARDVLQNGLCACGRVINIDLDSDLFEHGEPCQWRKIVFVWEPGCSFHR